MPGHRAIECLLGTCGPLRHCGNEGLRKCMSFQLFSMVENSTLCFVWCQRYNRLFFHPQKRILVFPRGRSIERKITYQSYRRRPVRHVVKAGGRKIDGSGPAYYRHAAFAARFVEFRDQWYLAIEPTYHFTTDGYEEYPFASERLAGIKRLANDGDLRWGLTRPVTQLLRPTTT
jgi:hypothetical protein